MRKPPQKSREPQAQRDACKMETATVSYEHSSKNSKHSHKNRTLWWFNVKSL